MHIIGVDEVGRGCLFGPVVSAAVSFVSDDIPTGLGDSKKLSPKKRDVLFEELMSGPHMVSVADCSAAEIDELNILKASLYSMKKAVEGLGMETSQIQEVRVDGIFKIPDLNPKIPQVTLVQGDSKDASIAAASIVAKVFRDRLVASLEEEFPGYGLAKHKGYPTKAHKEALKKLGVSSQHRRTFKGVSELL